MLSIKPLPLLLQLGALYIHAADGQNLVWSEEFNGNALNPETWNFDLGGGGWGNDELQIYREENVAVANGVLTITARKVETQRGPNTAIDFTSGRIKTNQKFAFTYGTVEARMQVPNLADGLWPALWMLGANFDEGVGWPDCGEIDVMEMGYQAWLSSDACLNSCDPDCLGNGPGDPSCVCCGGDGTINKSVGSAFHFERNAAYSGYYCEPRYLANADFAGTGKWVDFTLEWTPDFVETHIEVDGVTEQICRFDISNPLNSDLEEFHKPFFFIANLAVGGRYTGLLYQKDRITADFPAELKIDYIRVYDNGFTVLPNTSSPTKAPTPTSSPTTRLPTPPTGGCLGKGSICTVNADCCSSKCQAKGPSLKCG